ncbi:hypothetical protein BC835DRAFT_1415684 [Cytidiella melzeri]|nr:hypothetical protein BC835DRAFT_1415684 [Cytidiella melzeri]
MTSVYLGGVPAGISERELRGHLEIYGRVNALSMQKGAVVDAFLGSITPLLIRACPCYTPAGYAFVEYDSEVDAKDVVANFANKPLMGYDIASPDIKVQLAKKPRRQTIPASTPSPEADHNSGRSENSRVRYPVVIYNLDPRTCWQELKDFGRLAGGEVVFCNIDQKDRTRGYVEFHTQEDADRLVLEGEGKELLGRRVSLSPRGRQILRPEHGPRSRSPTSRLKRRYSSTSGSIYSFRGRSRSRSRSPIPPRRHGFDYAPRSPRRSAMLLPSTSRYDDEQQYRNSDRCDYPQARESYYRSPPRVLEREHPGQDLVARAGGARLDAHYSLPDAYIDVCDERRTHMDRMEAQWMQYNGALPGDPFY